MTESSFFFFFLFHTGFLSLCVHSPDLQAQVLFTGIVCRNTDNKVTIELLVRKMILLLSRQQEEVFTLLT